MHLLPHGDQVSVSRRAAARICGNMMVPDIVTVNWQCTATTTNGRFSPMSLYPSGSRYPRIKHLSQSCAINIRTKTTTTHLLGSWALLVHDHLMIPTSQHMSNLRAALLLSLELTVNPEPEALNPARASYVLLCTL